MSMKQAYHGVQGYRQQARKSIHCFHCRNKHHGNCVSINCVCCGQIPGVVLERAIARLSR